jgi:hypothetical protein
MQVEIKHGVQAKKMNHNCFNKKWEGVTKTTYFCGKRHGPMLTFSNAQESRYCLQKVHIYENDKLIRFIEIRNGGFHHETTKPGRSTVRVLEYNPEWHINKIARKTIYAFSNDQFLFPSKRFLLGFLDPSSMLAQGVKLKRTEHFDWKKASHKINS